jgi:predicted amidohydrolase
VIEPASSLRVALLQTDPQLGAPEANLDVLHADLAAVPDADLAVAPELALSGYHVGDLDEVPALPADDERLRALGRHGPAVVVGFAEAWRHHRYNSAALVDGDRVTVQRKLYLPNYDAWEERKHFRPGAGLRCVDTRGTRLAVLVCNDLWQPPLPWLAAHDGAEVLVVIANSVHSASTVPVQRSWELLVAHAAVTLQAAVVFVNRAGVESGQQFWGGSCAVGPDGEPLVRLDAEPRRAVVEIDLAAVREARRRWPLLEPRFDLVAREAARLAAEEQ